MPENKQNDDRGGPSEEQRPGPDASGVYNENNNPMETQNQTFTGSTQAGLANNSSSSPKKVGYTTGDLPGLRLQNPLSSLSSYTYQVSLYMITPDAYRAFIESGRTKIDAITKAVDANAAAAVESSKSGAYIIAQSGGANNADGTRAFNTDFYIDELKITNLLQGPSTGTSSNDLKVSFNIYEPYGFSLISKLTKAGNLLRSSSKVKNYAKMSNATRQFFILGIRFQGYDENGKVISSSDTFHQDNFNIANDSGGVYERFFDIYINSFKFKIDGKVTVYNIEAVPVGPGVALGVKRGRVDKGAKVQGMTIDDALQGPDGLLTLLNKEQIKNAASTKNPDSIPTEYKLVYLGGAKNTIGDQPIVSIADMDKSRWPMGEGIPNLSNVNVGAEVKTIPNSTQRSITFANSLSIMQAIQSIITQSAYMENALNTIMQNDLEPEIKPNSKDVKKNNKPRTFKWYNLSSEVRVKGFDDSIKDFSYEITYIIQPYETPYVKSPYINATGKYYGAHKRYDYWYTGKNSEILSYEQTLNNAYFNATLNPAATNASSGGGYDVPTSPGKFVNEDKTGKLDINKQTQNSVLTSLFSPADYAEARIIIIGDPDYLMTESASSVNNVYRQFYGKGFTINPNGGQVFIEIDFKEGEDYNHNDGTLSINESILFWNYPKQVRNMVKGVSYMVRQVQHTFSKGKFTQELLCNVNTFNNYRGAEESPGAINNEMETMNATYTGLLGDAPPQTVNPESGNQAGDYNNNTSPNAANQTRDDAIINPSNQPADQGGRNTDTPDLASRNRLNASGLGGV